MIRELQIAGLREVLGAAPCVEETVASAYSLKRRNVPRLPVRSRDVDVVFLVDFMNAFDGKFVADDADAFVERRRGPAELRAVLDQLPRDLFDTWVVSDRKSVV